MAQCKSVLVFGATGLVGNHIMRHLLAKKARFDRIAVFTSRSTFETKPETIAQLKAEGVEVICGELTSADDVKHAYEGTLDFLRSAKQVQDLIWQAHEQASTLSFRPWVGT
jgi:nucleoside-diphosphate-sugar epimerase